MRISPHFDQPAEHQMGKILIEVRGDPHEVFRPREGGLTRIRCFRVVVVVGPQKPKMSIFQKVNIRAWTRTTRGLKVQ